MSDEEYCSDASMESDYGLLKKALPFDCVIPKNFDPNKVPRTAEEFLQYAAYERSLTKPWTTAKIDPSKLNNTTCNNFIEEKIENSVPIDFLPSNEWKNKKLNEFIEFRNYIQTKMKHTSKDILDDNFKDIFKTKSPKYSELIHYSQADKIKGLEIIIEYLNTINDGTTFEFNVGCWIYSILSLLDVPLSSDDCSVVRLLAKKCIIIRSNFKECIKEKYYPLNLIICIVSTFYGQLDLCDA